MSSESSFDLEGRGAPDDNPGLIPEEDALLSVPSFANAENRELNERLVARNAQLAREAAETAEHQGRVQVMGEHLGALRVEMASAQRLLESKARELKTESHLAMLAERAAGRLRADAAALEREADGAHEALAGVQATLYRNSERLDTFRADMNWKQDELERWAVQKRAGEQNNIKLDEYTRGDEQKVRDLVRELETLTGRLAAKRREVDADVTETNARQVELDKLAEDFRLLHGERQDLIRRWQESLEVIHARDEEIARSAQRFADLRAQQQRRRALLDEQEKRLATLEGENADMESRTEFLGRQMGLAREDLAQWTARVNGLRDQVEILKNEVSAAAAELVQRRAENDNFAAVIEAKNKRADELRAELEATRARLRETRDTAVSLEEAVAKKESFLLKEAASIDKKQRDLAALKEAEYRARDTVAALHAEEGHLHGEISGLRRTIKNLGDKVRELDALSVRQQEHLYGAEFQIQQMERKIGRARGEVSDEERLRLEAKVGELTRECDEARATHKSLEAEAKAVKQALQNATRRSESMAEQLAELRSRIDELLLLTRSGDESLRRAVREKEEAMVAHDLLKLEVRKLRDALSSRTEDVFGLENRAAQLELSIEQRKKDVEAHRQLQRAQAKMAEDERHKLALDLGERAQRIAALRAKYETLCARTRGSDGSSSAADEAGGQGQAFFVLAAAQRREELQREGDELDRNVRRAEKEMKALAHTLHYLNARNDTIRVAFSRVEEGSDDAASVRALEAQANAAQDGLFKRKRQLAQLAQEREAAERQLADAADGAAGLQAQLEQLEAAAARAEAEQRQQFATVEAARGKLELARGRHRRARRTGGAAPTPDELAFLAQGLRDSNASVLFTLGQLAKGYAQLKPTLHALLGERNLRMPARPPSRVAGPEGGASVGVAAEIVGGVARTAGEGRASLAPPRGAIPSGISVSPMAAPPPPRGGSAQRAASADAGSSRGSATQRIPKNGAGKGAPANAPAVDAGLGVTGRNVGGGRQ